jgi:hypothetical protein
MAVRSDVHVEWWRSPRVIVVEAPSTSITVEDLVDTLRDLEDNLPNLDDDELLDASGRQELDPQRQVGITVTLLNAVISFEARRTAVCSGTATAVGSSKDYPGTILEDSNASFEGDQVAEGDTVFNISDSSLATITQVIDQTHLRHYDLVDGTDNTWEVGDYYKIFPAIECSITGGNVVAIDVNGDPISPIISSTFTSVSRESSTSAAIVVTGSGVTAQDKIDIITGTWNEIMAEGTELPGSFADLLRQAANNEQIIIF